MLIGPKVTNFMNFYAALQVLAQKCQSWQLVW